MDDADQAWLDGWYQATNFDRVPDLLPHADFKKSYMKGFSAGRDAVAGAGGWPKWDQLPRWVQTNAMNEAWSQR